MANVTKQYEYTYYIPHKTEDQLENDIAHKEYIAKVDKDFPYFYEFSETTEDAVFRAWVEYNQKANAEIEQEEFIDKWCLDNFEDNYCIWCDYVNCKNSSDAMLFKMTWG